MLRRTFLALVIVLSAAVPAAAQVKLEQKHTPGTSIKQEDTVQLDQTFFNQLTKVNNKATTLITYAAGPTDGSVNVSRKIEALVANINTGGIEIKFDSADPSTFKAANEIAQVFVDLIKKQLESVIEYSVAGGQVGEVKGIAEGSLQHPEDQRAEVQQSLARLPTEEIQPGHTWERTEEADVGQGQTLSTTRKYTYVGAVDKFATVKGGKQLQKIEYTDSDIKFFVKPGRGFPGELKKSDLKIKEAKGTLLFDAELGRVVQSDGLLHVNGDLELDIMGMNLASPLDLKIVTMSKEL